jgi:vacuolar-type H+-ATPase subunit F/Vma7
MSSVVAIGEEELVAGYALAGAAVLPARRDDEVLAAWEALPPDTALVLLTQRAHAVLGETVRERQLLWAVLPE